MYIYQRADGDGRHIVGDHDFVAGSITPFGMKVLKTRFRRRPLSVGDLQTRESTVIPNRHADDSDLYRNKQDQEDVWRYKDGILHFNIYPSKGGPGAAAYLARHLVDIINRSRILVGNGSVKIKRLIILTDNGPDTNTQHESNVLVYSAFRNYYQ